MKLSTGSPSSCLHRLNFACSKMGLCLFTKYTLNYCLKHYTSLLCLYQLQGRQYVLTHSKNKGVDLAGLELSSPLDPMPAEIWCAFSTTIRLMIWKAFKLAAPYWPRFRLTEFELHLRGNLVWCHPLGTHMCKWTICTSGWVKKHNQCMLQLSIMCK